MKKYVLASAGISLVSLLIYFLLGSRLGLHPFLAWVILFFLLQSLLVGWIFSLGERDRERWITFVIGGMSIRLVTGVIFLVVLILTGMVNTVALVIQFGALYLVYLVFELIVALSNLRRN